MKRFQDNNKVLLNPGMGWVMHTSIEQGYKDHNEFDPHPNIQVVALLSSWAKIEVSEGVFDFRDLDQAVEKWSKLKKEIHLRISTDPMIYRESAFGVPEYLFTKYGVPYQEKIIYGLKAKFPDYLNPIYLEKVYRFVDTVVTRYYQHPNVVLMDLRGYGEWGEWHSGYMHETVEAHVLAVRTVIQTWDKACNGRIPLALSASYEWRRDQSLFLFAPKSYAEYLYFSGFDYALSKNTITYRRDGLGGALKYYDYEIFQDYFHNHHHLPLTTEFFMAYDRQKEAIDGVRGYFAEDALEEALSLHPNYMMLMWDSKSFFDERQDLIEHGLKRVGYRLMPIEIELIQEKDIVIINHTWVNHGVGRLYLKHECHIIVIDTQGNTYSINDDFVNLHSVIENQATKFKTILKVKPMATIQSIKVGIYLTDNKTWMKIPVNEFDGEYLHITF